MLHVREPQTATLRQPTSVEPAVQRFWSAPTRTLRCRNFAFEVIPDATGVTICANVPGLDASAVRVSVEGPVLTISGARQSQARQRGAYQLRERVFGSFSHTFHLADDLEPGGIEASCHDGVLTIRVPKRAQSEPRQIKINVA